MVDVKKWTDVCVAPNRSRLPRAAAGPRLFGMCAPGLGEVHGKGEGSAAGYSIVKAEEGLAPSTPRLQR